jgi:Flp pilus assembly protein protease CpaA
MLPGLPWAGAFLCAATHQDISHRRIPNWLTFPGIGLALALAASSAGWIGVKQGALGLMLAFGLLFFAYAARGLGAGDVKAAMVLGALWGPHVALAVLVWTAAISGALAGGLMLWNAVRSHTAVIPLEIDASGRRGIPLAPAISLGVIAYQLWGDPGPLS